MLRSLRLEVLSESATRRPLMTSVRVIKGMAGRHVLGAVHRQLFQGHDREKRRWEWEQILFLIRRHVRLFRSWTEDKQKMGR